MTTAIRNNRAQQYCRPRKSVVSHPAESIKAGTSCEIKDPEVEDLSREAFKENQEVYQIPPWKRVLDISVSLTAILILSPVFLLIAIYIKIVSNGPLLFRQERVGFQGRVFTCLKFRTMKVGACTNGHQCYFQDLIKSEKPMTKLDSKGDSRIIPMGWVLRATGLDELPQVFNVLIGDMSIVGPRPSIPSEFEHFSDYQRKRCNTLPGLTGLWQVSGKNNTTFSEMIDFDVKYTESKTLWMDLGIIIKTPIALIEQLKQTYFARIREEITPNREAANLKA